MEGGLKGRDEDGGCGGKGGGWLKGLVGGREVGGEGEG